MKKVIKFRPSLFWDVDPKAIRPQKHARYIIERVLDFGLDSEVRWLINYYPQKKIKDAVYHSRALHNKTRTLWELILKK